MTPTLRIRYCDEASFGFSPREFQAWTLYSKMLWCNGPDVFLWPVVHEPKIKHPFKRVMRHHRISKK